MFSEGLECQRPQHQSAKDKDREAVSTGTDSPELCTPDTTPPGATPDLSPLLGAPASPPRSPAAHRPRNACFMRQGAVDDHGAAEIQVLVEGRGSDPPRGGANNWSDAAYPDATPSLLEEQEGRVNGHEQAPNHKPREKPSANHKPREHASSYRAWEHNQKPAKQASSNHKSREYSSSNHKTRDHSSTNHKASDHASSNYKPQVHIVSNHKALEHNASNHKTSEHASSNHKAQDYISSNHSAKDHVSSSYGHRDHAHSNHHPKQHNDQRAEGVATLRWSPAHSRLAPRDEERTSDYTVDMRLQGPDSQAAPPRGPGPESPAPENGRLRARALRPVREGSVDSVQMLDSLTVGAELEEWPLHRDLTLSPPLKSQPIALEPEGEALKASAVSQRGQ